MNNLMISYAMQKDFMLDGGKEDLLEKEETWIR